MTPADLALKDARQSSNSKRGGCYTGRVESCSDPEQRDRIRVRIFQLHGDVQDTPTEGLPWANVAEFGGGGPDYGSAGRMYPVGSMVWVMFEGADERFPVVIGGRRGQLLRDSGGTNPQEFLTIRGEVESIDSPWLPAEGNETPVDIFADSVDGDINPTRTVWQKSFKGHTFLVEDRDGHEFLRIIDRAGQVIEMDCPVLEDVNKSNTAQRGNRNAVDDTQLSQDQLVNGRAFIRFKDIAGQEIILDGSSSNEEIRITSQSRLGAAKQQIILSSKKGREKIQITDKAGNTFLMDPNSPQPITLKDYAGNMLQFDADAGQVLLQSLAKSKETVRSDKAEDIGGSLIQTIVGDARAKVLGNKFVDVMNDFAASISGFTNVIVGAAMEIQINNAGASGVKEKGFAMSVITGDIDVNTKLGDVKGSTLAGDVELSTLAGAANLKTTAGNVEVSSGAGNVAVKTATGNVEVKTNAGSMDVKTSAGALTVTTGAGAATLGSEGGTTTIKGPAGVTLGTGGHNIAFGDALFTFLSSLVTALNDPANAYTCAAPSNPAVPGSAIVALTTQLATIGPGLGFSLLNKTN